MQLCIYIYISIIYFLITEPEDYGLVNIPLVFSGMGLGSGMFGNRECFNVGIVDDALLEGSENLTLLLSNPFNARVEFRPDPNIATISIIDNDGKL